MHIYMYKCVCVFMWRPDINQPLYQWLFILFWEQGLLLGVLEFPISAHLASKLQGPSISVPQGLGLQEFSAFPWSWDLNLSLYASTGLSSGPSFPARKPWILDWLLRKTCISPTSAPGPGLFLSSCSFLSSSFHPPASLLFFWWWESNLMT